MVRSYLKKVFWPNLRVGSSFQLLGIPEYACRRSRQQAGRVEPRPRLFIPLGFSGGP